MSEHDELITDISSLRAEQTKLSHAKQELEVKLEEAEDKITEVV